ncbi:MAG: sensor protein [Rhodospirillales bacterium]|jgi:CheY-like chemotaxis protein|nr:sensor protein [Rhodospirillales bacterium]
MVPEMKRKETLVLVVDDDAEVLGFEASALSGAGYRVIASTRASHALKFFRSVKIDLVVTDVRMPEMDGVEFAKRVKAISPATAVICASGFASAATEGRNAPCDAFIEKPIAPAALTRHVGALLDA